MADTDVHNKSGGHRQEHENPDKDKMPPPQGQPLSNAGALPAVNQAGNQRQDSISMYTNFNQPRLSTDSSISSFLNIDNQNDPRGSASQMGQGPNNPGQDLPYSRGFSIVNNLWNAPAPPQNDVAFTTTRRQSEQLEPFMPKFNTSSFTQSSKGLPSNNQQVHHQVQTQGQGQQRQAQQQQQSNAQIQNSVAGMGRGDSASSSKRNSIYFPPTDNDLDFFNPGKRNSMVMKPPLIKPNVNGQNQQGSNHDDMEVPFFQGPLSRKNSIKFNPDDFADFQFKRRDSSVRATLDNSNYMPAPPKRMNDGSLSPIDHQLVDNDVRDGSVHHSLDHRHIDDDEDDDVETRLHKHLSSLVDSVKMDKSPKKKKQRLNKKQKDMDDSNKEMNSPNHTSNDMGNNSGDQLQPLGQLNGSISGIEDTKPLLGATKVDQLMLVIQARKNGVTDKVSRSADGSLLLDSAPSIIPPLSQLVGGVEKPKSKGLKQFQCAYCHKYFTQSTHLEVHVRSHIGYKPFSCDFCGKRFTQGGNLRTHIRLHTGEKPYECERCGRKFSRKGNLAAHKLTHDNLKPFQCKLDDCNKTFTQLGNMKAHQNRFHLQTLNRLTQRLAEMDPNENISQKERELLDYFASIYRNSNRGIKGRGKGNQNIVPLNAYEKHHQLDDPSVRVAAKALGSLNHSKQPSPMAYETSSNASIHDKNNQFSFPEAETQLDDAAYAATGAIALGSRRSKSPSEKEKVQFKDVNFIR